MHVCTHLRGWMHASICIYIYIYMYIYVYIYTYISLYAYIRTCIYLYIYIYIYLYIYIGKYIQMCICIFICQYICIYRYIHLLPIYVYMYLYLRTCMCMCECVSHVLPRLTLFDVSSSRQQILHVFCATYLLYTTPPITDLIWCFAAASHILCHVSSLCRKNVFLCLQVQHPWKRCQYCNSIPICLWYANVLERRFLVSQGTTSLQNMPICQ